MFTDPHEQELSSEERQRLKRFVRPLILIFWGGPFITFNINLVSHAGNHTSSIDLLPNAIGFLLVAVGLSILVFGKFFKGAQDLVVTAVAVVFAAFSMMAFSGWFTPALVDLAPWGQVLLGMIGGLALTVFCLAMRSVALELNLHSFARAWLVVGVLFIMYYTFPQVPLLIVGFVGYMGLLGLIVGALELLPFVALFVVALQMKRVASTVVKAPPT